MDFFLIFKKVSENVLTFEIVDDIFDHIIPVKFYMFSSLASCDIFVRRQACLHLHPHKKLLYHHLFLLLS